jgi:signal transduction histidine kinase
MRRGLTGRMVVAGGVLAILVGAAFAVLLVAITNFSRATDQRRDTREELVAAEALQKLVIDFETGLRGFVITRDERFLEPFNGARAALPEASRALVTLASDGPVEAARVRRIVQAAKAYLRQYALPLVAAVRRNDASARSVESTDAGKRRIDALRARFDRLSQAGRASLDARETAADQAARRATVAAGVGVAASFILICVFTGYLTRVIVYPLRKAALMADRLAHGDLSARMGETDVAEIGVLERSFNVMASSLGTSRDELASLLAELTASRARIVTASDDARRRIERDLHDGAQQRLVSLALQLRTEQRSSSWVVEELGGVLDDLHEISRGIHPTMLAEGGLGPALKTLARRSAIPVEINVQTRLRFADAIELAAYYVVSEALTNAVKHARPSVVRVAAEDRDDILHLWIRDDGIGGADPSRGSGIVGLKDRVEALGGRIAVTSASGEGTTVYLQLPADPRAAPTPSQALPSRPAGRHQPNPRKYQ